MSSYSDSTRASLLEEQRDEDIIDSTLWHALLTSIQHARVLCVHAALGGDPSRALHPDDGPTVVGEDIKPEPGPEAPHLFPELPMVVLLHRDDEDVLTAASEALDVFIDGRNCAGHPVNVEPRDLNRLIVVVVITDLSTSGDETNSLRLCKASARRRKQWFWFLTDPFLLFAVHDFVPFHHQTLRVQDVLQRGTRGS